MSQLKDLLDNEAQRISADPGALGSTLHLRDRRHRNRRIAAAVVALGVFAAIIALFAGSIRMRTSQPASPVPIALHHNGEIAVFQDVLKDGVWEGRAVTIDPVSGRLVKLAISGTGPSGTIRTTEPSWSSDGSKVAYVLTRTLWVLDVSTGQSREIARCGPCETPAWSPDGSTIAVGVGGPTPAIDLFDARTTALTRLLPIEDLGGISSPAWSPDGQHIAFISGSQGGSRALYTMRRDGSDLQLVGRRAFLAVAWSPDGSRIAYLNAPHWGSWDAGRCHQYVCPISVVVVQANGSTARTSFFAGKCFCGSSKVGLAWSPDGTQLALTIPGPGKRSDFGLYVASPDGTGLRLVLAGAWGQPSWRPVS